MVYTYTNPLTFNNIDLARSLLKYVEGRFSDTTLEKELKARVEAYAGSEQ